MLLIKRGGHAWNILMLLLITGEFPFRSLSLLGNERMLKATAVRMSDVHDIRFYDSDKTYRCRLITISGKSTWKTMRLCRSGFDLIADEMPELLTSYLEDTYGHRFHGEKRVTERNHRIAEASVMCMKAGIECRRHLVPALQKIEFKQIDFHDPAFYSSKTIKRLGVDEINKSKYLRMVGAIFSQAGMYEIYNSRGEVLEWYGQGEDKIIRTMDDVCKYNFRIPERHRAIILGQNYDVAIETIRRFEAGDKYVQLDYTGYESMHFLPMDKNGLKLLQIMMVMNWERKLTSLIFEPRYLPKDKHFLYDARIDDTYVLSFLDSDILKLSAFLKTVTQEEVAWEVACFDVQLPFLRKYLGDDAVINPIPLKVIHKQLNAGRRSLI